MRRALPAKVKLRFAAALHKGHFLHGEHWTGRCATSRCTRPVAVVVHCSSSDENVANKPTKPAFELEAEDVLEIQLEYLRTNTRPYVDHGIEVLYRFADIDPFEIRCRYFGADKSMDLGQFERFRRMLHTNQYRALLNHTEARELSMLKLSDHKVKSRYLVEGFRPGEKGIFEWTLVQKVGGLKDGYWFTESLVSDDFDLNTDSNSGG